MFPSGHSGGLTTKPSAISSAQANSKPEEDLAVPANEAQAVTSIRPTEETKRINLGFVDERKKLSSVPSWMTNRKARSSSFCKITETYSHGNLWICWESRENWSSTN
jgi:hypothetical protein